MPDGSIQYQYEGIQVRKVPLPLRLPPSAQIQSQPAPPTQPQIIKPMPNSLNANNARVQLPLSNNLTAGSTPNAQANQGAGTPPPPGSPGSPILTHLLHRNNKNEAPNIDPKVGVIFLYLYRKFIQNIPYSRESKSGLIQSDAIFGRAYFQKNVHIFGRQFF